jgi:type VI secretion system protein ImpL
LSTMASAPSSVKAAFNNTEKRFNTHGKGDPITGVLQVATTAPQPVQSWLNAIAHNSWQLMLSNTKIYLNSVWKATVLQQYNQTIKGRYPIFKDEKKDISTTNFNKFFGPSGIVGAFFNNNLKPLINTNQAYWTWKKLDDEQIDITQSTLDMLIRASMIQKMFYSNNASKPSLKFTLTPISMSTNVSQFILNIGGQMIQYMPGIKHTNNVKWPGPDGNFVTMRFDNLDPKKPTQTNMGAWAWLHLLDTATIKPSSDPRSYEVTFNLKGNQADYQLTADNPINPYLPNVLGAFRCPVSF